MISLLFSENKKGIRETFTSWAWRSAAFISMLIALPLFIAGFYVFESLIYILDLTSPAAVFVTIWNCILAIFGIVGFFACADAIKSPPNILNLRSNIIITDMMCFGILGLMMSLEDVLLTFGDLALWLIIPVAFSVCYGVTSISLASKNMRTRFRWSAS